MEYVDGVDLKALIEWRRRINRRIPVAHSLYVIMEICKGLSYAHELPQPRDRRAARHRPPRHLAAQRAHLQAGRGQGRGLRPRQGDQPDRDDRPRRRQGQDELPVARGGARRGGRLAAPTSSPSASCSTRCSPGSGSSTARPTTRPSSWCATPRSRRCGRRTRRSSPSSRTSCARRSPKRKEDRYQSADRPAGRAGAVQLLARAQGHLARHRRARAAVPRRQADAVGRGEEAEHHRPHPAGRDRQVHLGRLRGRGRAAALADDLAPRPEPPPVARRRGLHRSARLGRRAAGAGNGRRRDARRSRRAGPRATRRPRRHRAGPAPAAERMRVPTGENRAPPRIRRPSARRPSRRRAPKRWPASSSRRPAHRRSPFPTGRRRRQATVAGAVARRPQLPHRRGHRNRAHRRRGRGLRLQARRPAAARRTPTQPAS